METNEWNCKKDKNTIDMQKLHPESRCKLNDDDFIESVKQIELSFI
jgi:hypothetical protein